MHRVIHRYTCDGCGRASEEREEIPPLDWAAVLEHPWFGDSVMAHYCTDCLRRENDADERDADSGS